jgi:hypothetical protein
LLTEFGIESGEMNNTKVIENFDTFQESINAPHRTNGSGVMITAIGGAAGNSFWTD